VTVPQVLPRRLQKAWSVSGMQAQTFVVVQVCGDRQTPHEATVRVAPQLSVLVTIPQVLPRRPQKVWSLSGAHGGGMGMGAGTGAGGGVTPSETPPQISTSV